MYENGMMSPADFAAVTGNKNSDGAFGGDNGWWIILLFLLAGRGGWGFGGNGGYGGGESYSGSGCGCHPCATQADVRAAVDQQTLISKLDQQTYGLADSTYALNNTITAGFHGVDNALCSLGYNFQSGINGISHQLSDCCCQTQRAIDGVNFNIAKGLCDIGNAMNTNTRDILESQNNNTRAILDFLTQDKIATLTAENQSLKFAASQSAQNAYIGATIDAGVATLTRRLGADCPTPAYVVQPPTPVSFPLNCCGQVQFGQQHGGCGCGSSYAYN